MIAETLSTGFGAWNPIVWLIALAVALVIAWLIQRLGEADIPGEGESGKPYISGNDEPSPEDGHIGGSNLYWGFTEAMKVAGWCEAHYIDMMPHNPLGPVCTMACIHLSAAVPNFAWLEDWSTNPIFEMDPDVFPGLLQLEGDRYPLPTAPGLGIELNEEKADQQFRFSEQPHLHRRDGSKTNW